MTIDFLPERIIIQRARIDRLFRQGYLVGVVLTVLVGLAYFNEERIGRAEAHMAGLDGQSANLKIQVETMFKLQKQLSGLMIKQRIDNCLGSRINGMDILGELGDILPKSMTLTSLQLDALQVKVPLKSASTAVSAKARGGRKTREKLINRLKLTITGLGPNNVDVANFIADLSASPLFEDVDMGYAKNIEFRQKKAKEFQASCYVVR
ncbi:MAG: PilN domain-containing protein [Phycisphaerae bacterium]|nr:PilN domain-containing protein [Phycisphaerae bacterium]MDP7289658.1 PilN domain-containing protein [Phycisphaerae bacterium]